MTTFGDGSPRTGFPHFAGQIDRYPRKDGLPAALKSGKLDDAWRQLACLMFELREGERDVAQLSLKCGIVEQDSAAWLGLLAELRYIAESEGRYRAIIPVLTVRDRPMVQRILSIGRAAITDWLEADFAKLKADLAGTAPARSGVPFEEGFTLIYHYVFGRANALLVESGLYADPYSPRSSFKGYSPIVFDPKVLQ
jgi:hypothetical protein